MQEGAPSHAELKRKIEELLRKGANMSQPKHAALIRAYKEQVLIEQESSLQVAPSYIITQYSLPKALTRA